jgi:hypothetical protein
MGTPLGWGLEHRASNPVSVKNLTAIETSTIVKLLRPYGPVGTKRTRRRYVSTVVALEIFIAQFYCPCEIPKLFFVLPSDQYFLSYTH